MRNGRSSYKTALSETQRKRSFERRILVVHGVLLLCTLTIVSRLIELQIIKHKDYAAIAQAQQYGGVTLPAKRGEILSRNSKTDETSILATNRTLDLLYIDPSIMTRDHALIADTLADILLTQEADAACRQGTAECPTELVKYYQDAFDPLKKFSHALQANLGGSGAVFTGSGLLVPVPMSPAPVPLPDITEMRRLFARNIESRIREKRVTFVVLQYGANKVQQAKVAALNIAGVYVNPEQKMIYVNPEIINQKKVNEIARILSPILVQDIGALKSLLSQRKLRYVPIMGKLPPEMSQKIRKLKEASRKSIQKAIDEAKDAKSAPKLSNDPYRALALIPEHWRFYPDTRIASHVLGFITLKNRGRQILQEPQYGIERSFDQILRGQEGLIASVSDPLGGQIVSSDQTFIDPRDGATVVLTIDRFVQERVESLLEAMLQKVDAESGQAIVMDPFTGKIIAMANAPRFDNNRYAAVYEKEPVLLTPQEEEKVIVEVYDPTTNLRVMKAFLPQLKPENRSSLSPELQQKVKSLEELYDMTSISRYFLPIGDVEKNNNRREIFPTEQKSVWLKYKNNIGIGSYVNRTIQEIYEPGSVMKAVTMAIAIDQGEVTPSDTYDDLGPVKVDEFPIRNALSKYYGLVSMTDCLSFSINTCLQSVSQKLGRKLFHSQLQKFGFGSVTGIELDNELPGALKDWRAWRNSDLSTSSFGQGISVTPLQMITAYAPLANGGKLVKPTIIDEIQHSDGTVVKNSPTVIGQVIKPETSETITAVLVRSADDGIAFAGKPKGYIIAGKTGTSQIAGPGGKYETGTGSTIASFAGYAPVSHPRFMILVKLDRPKRDDFGSKSAAPLFKDIATFLFEYYGIPPDDKNRR